MTTALGRADAQPDAWYAAWSGALAELELDVDAAEAMIAQAHLGQLSPAPVWVPPTGLGPMPAALVDRAQALLDRHVDVAQRLAEAANLSRRHQRAAQIVRDASSSPASPVYVDTPA